MAFIPTARLSPSDIRTVRTILGNRPVVRLFFEAALAAARDGAENRAVLIGAAGRGVVLSIDFDRVTVRTTVGALRPEEVAAAATTVRRAELHLEPAHLAPTKAVCAGRIEAERTLRYYLLEGMREGSAGAAPDPRCRPLGPADRDRVTAFFRAHYPATVFSAWMLEQPFLGLFEAGRLRACGGVIAMDRQLGEAHLGNFLTHPDHRGRGLGRAVARSLVHRLAGAGLRRVSLAANAENAAACRTYEAVGFRLVAARPELVVGPG